MAACLSTSSVANHAHIYQVTKNVNWQLSDDVEGFRIFLLVCANFGRSDSYIQMCIQSSDHNT